MPYRNGNGLNLQKLAIIVAFLFQFCGLLWGAATLVANQKTLTEQRAEDKEITKGIVAIVQSMQIIQAVQTEQILSLKAKIK